jgi:hypothetical protein
VPHKSRESRAQGKLAHAARGGADGKGPRKRDLAGGLPDNQVVASVAASYVEKLLTGSCRWMASYFDMDDGFLRCIPAEPVAVARVAGLHLNAVAPVPHREAGAGPKPAA